MRILIVEDSATDAELLRYLLDTRFPKTTSYFDATTFDEAVRMLERLDFDCVILDLNLPDSVGATTFTNLNQRFPYVPIIVMTHNKDRQLALRMVREGAADYLLKDFRANDENIEQVFSRIAFAIERHRHSIRVPPSEAKAMQKMKRAQANMISAHQSGQHKAITTTTVEAASAQIEVTQQMIVEVQRLSNEVARSNAQYAHTAETVDGLERELIRGHSGRPSMRSQVDLMEHRLGEVEDQVEKVVAKAAEAEATKQKAALELSRDRISNRTKIWLGLFSLLGIIVTALGTYFATMAKASNPKLEDKQEQHQ